jgi:hypothetical protein
MATPSKSKVKTTWEMGTGSSVTQNHGPSVILSLCLTMTGMSTILENEVDRN